MKVKRKKRVEPSRWLALAWVEDCSGQSERKRETNSNKRAHSGRMNSTLARPRIREREKIKVSKPDFEDMKYARR